MQTCLATGLFFLLLHLLRGLAPVRHFIHLHARHQLFGRAIPFERRVATLHAMYLLIAVVCLLLAGAALISGGGDSAASLSTHFSI